VTYCKAKKSAFRKRKQAIKSGIPHNFLSLADFHLNRAIFIRAHPAAKAHEDCKYYQRSTSELIIAIEVFDAQISNIFSKRKNLLLAEDMNRGS
jgi:hypothetical protein